jgi:hypothetical protein
VTLSILSLALPLAFYLGLRWGRHQVHNDPAHIDHMARKDRHIASLESSLAKVKQQRNLLAEQCRRLRDKGAVG